MKDFNIVYDAEEVLACMLPPGDVEEEEMLKRAIAMEKECLGPIFPGLD